MLFKTLKFVIFLFLLASVPLSGQSNFIEATVFKTKTDSINGFIDYQEWYQNPKTIDFKANNSQKIEVLTAANVFKIIIPYKSEIFQSAIVDINRNDMDKLDNGEKYPSREEAINDFKLTHDTILLRAVVKGAVNFYKYIDERDIDHFFIQKEQGAITELLNYHFNIRTFDSTFTVYFKPYQSLLTNTVLDCSKMNRDFRKLSLYEANVKKIVKEYNQCVGKVEFVKPAEKKKAAFYVFAGPVLPIAKVTDPPDRINNITGKLTGTIGVGVQTKMSYKRQPFQIGAELNFGSVNFNYSKSRFEGEDIKVHKAALVGIHLSPFIRYNFFGKKSYETFGFCKMGPVLSYYVKGSYERYRQGPVIYYPPLGLFQYSNEKLKNTAFSIFTSVGINVKKISVEARFEPYGLSLIRGDYFNEAILKVGHISLLLAYKFK